MPNNALDVIGPALAASKKVQDQISANIVGASRNAAEITAQRVQDVNGASKVEFVRAEDPAKFHKVLTTSAKAAEASTGSDYLEQISNTLGDPNSPQHLAQRLGAMVNALGNVYENTEAGRADIVLAVNDFCAGMQECAASFSALAAKTDKDISNAADAVNALILQIVGINKQLASSGDLSARDNLEDAVKALGQYIRLAKVSYTDRGEALIITEVGSSTLVGQGLHAQLAYDPDNGKYLSVEYTDSSTTWSIDTPVTNFGGVFTGLAKMRDEVLPQAISALNTIAKDVASEMNAIHNSGNAASPARQFTAEIPMSLNDAMDLSGKVNFAIVDDNGQPILDADGLPMRAVGFDLAKIAAKVKGQVTVEDLKDEINYAGRVSGEASVAIGALPVVGGEPQEYLIDGIRLVPNTNPEGDRFGFQLELSSGSRFDASFEITAITVADGGGAGAVIGSLPQAFDLTAGETAKMPTTVVVEVNDPTQTDTTVTISFRVIGANGVMEEGTADFVIGDGATALSDRTLTNIRFNGNNAVGDAVVVPAKTGGPMITARFVDENGFTVTDPDQTGYLRISSTAGRIIIDNADSNFSSAFGLNNLLVIDEENPAASIALSKEIAADSSRLSLNSSSVKPYVVRDVVKGTVKSTGTFTLVNNPIAGDTVTINGVTFTFVAAHNAAGEVAIVGDVNATMDNLVAEIRASKDRRISHLIDSVAAGNALTLTAKYAGLAGNDITTTHMFVTPADAVWTAANLIGGAEGNATEQVPCFALQTGLSTANPFNETAIAVVDAFSTGFLSEVIRLHDKAESDASVAEKVADWAEKEFNKATRADEDRATVQSFAELQHYYNLCTILQQALEASRTFLRAVTGG